MAHKKPLPIRMIPPRLLILDDEAPVAEAISWIARSIGWQVSTTHDPQEAMALLRNNAADVFLTDYNMPQCNGLEVIENLRLGQSTMPVILMSGLTRTIDRSRAQRLGVLAVLEKPFDLHLLTDALKQALALIPVQPEQMA